MLLLLSGFNQAFTLDRELTKQAWFHEESLRGVDAAAKVCTYLVQKARGCICICRLVPPCVRHYANFGQRDCA